MVHTHAPSSRPPRAASLRDAIREWLLSEGCSEAPPASELRPGDALRLESAGITKRIPEELRERMLLTASSMVEAAVSELEELGALAVATIEAAAVDIAELAVARIDAGPAVRRGIAQQGVLLSDVVGRTLEALAAVSGGSRITAACELRRVSSSIRAAWPSSHGGDSAESLAREWERLSDGISRRACASLTSWEGAA